MKISYNRSFLASGPGLRISKVRLTTGDAPKPESGLPGGGTDYQVSGILGPDRVLQISLRPSRTDQSVELYTAITAIWETTLRGVTTEGVAWVISLDGVKLRRETIELFDITGWPFPPGHVDLGCSPDTSFLEGPGTGHIGGPTGWLGSQEYEWTDALRRGTDTGLHTATVRTDSNGLKKHA